MTVTHSLKGFARPCDDPFFPPPAILSALMDSQTPPKATQSSSTWKGARKRGKATQGSQKGKGKGRKRRKDDPKQLKLSFVSATQPSVSTCLAATEGSVAGPSTQPLEENQPAKQISMKLELTQLKITFTSQAAPRSSSRPATRRTQASQSATQAPPPTQLKQTQIPAAWAPSSSNQAAKPLTQPTKHIPEIPKVRQMKLLDWAQSGGVVRYPPSQNAMQVEESDVSGSTEGPLNTQASSQIQATQSTQISFQISGLNFAFEKEQSPDLFAPGARFNSAGDYTLTEGHNTYPLCYSGDTITKTEVKRLFRLHAPCLEKCPTKQCLVRDHSVKDPKAKIMSNSYVLR